MSETRIRNYRQKGAFAQWSQSAHPAMLVLTGINNENIVHMKVYCWLSPIAIDVMERCRNEGIIYAFHTFCNDDSANRSISSCLLVIAAQLLQTRTQRLGDSHLSLLSHAQDISRLADSKDDISKTNAIGRFLRRLIKTFHQDEVVYIVIDRVDLCRESDRDDIPRVLADVLNESGCKLKVLIVTQQEYDWKLNSGEIRAILRPPSSLWLESKTQGIAEYMA